MKNFVIVGISDTADRICLFVERYHSTIFDSVRIGKKCLIGGATVVKRNVLDFSVVKTPNDTMIIKQYPEDVIESKWQAHHNIR